MSQELIDRLLNAAECGENANAGHLPTPALLRESALALVAHKQHIAELEQWVARGEELLRDADNIAWFRLGVWWTERPWRKQ